MNFLEKKWFDLILILLIGKMIWFDLSSSKMICFLRPLDLVDLERFRQIQIQLQIQIQIEILKCSYHSSQISKFDETDTDRKSSTRGIDRCRLSKNYFPILTKKEKRKREIKKEETKIDLVSFFINCIFSTIKITNFAPKFYEICQNWTQKCFDHNFLNIDAKKSVPKPFESARSPLSNRFRTDKIG